MQMFGSAATEPSDYRLQFGWNTTDSIARCARWLVLADFFRQRPRDPLSHPCRGESKHGVSEAFLIVRAMWHGLYRLMRHTCYGVIADWHSGHLCWQASGVTMSTF